MYNLLYAARAALSNPLQHANVIMQHLFVVNELQHLPVVTITQHLIVVAITPHDGMIAAWHVG